MTSDVGAQSLLAPGADAPSFTLESDSGSRSSLADFKDKWLIVYFYPRDNTPGCTRQAREFTQALASFRKLGAEIVGISRDTVKSHVTFRDKQEIGFSLLSDPELVAHHAYGAWGTKTMYGKKTQGTLRSTFLVTPEGKVAEVWRSVRVDGHADAVLAALKRLSQGPAPKPERKARS